MGNKNRNASSSLKTKYTMLRAIQERRNTHRRIKLLQYAGLRSHKATRRNRTSMGRRLRFLLKGVFPSVHINIREILLNGKLRSVHIEYFLTDWIFNLSNECQEVL